MSLWWITKHRHQLLIWGCINTGTCQESLRDDKMTAPAVSSHQYSGSKQLGKSPRPVSFVLTLMRLLCGNAGPNAGFVQRWHSVLTIPQQRKEQSHIERHHAVVFLSSTAKAASCAVLYHRLLGSPVKKCFHRDVATRLRPKESTDFTFSTPGKSVTDKHALIGRIFPIRV